MPDEPLQPDVQPTDVAPPDPGLPLAPTAADGGADGGAAQADAPPDPGLPIGSPSIPPDSEGPFSPPASAAPPDPAPRPASTTSTASTSPTWPPPPDQIGKQPSLRDSPEYQAVIARAAEPDHVGRAGMRRAVASASTIPASPASATLPAPSAPPDPGKPTSQPGAKPRDGQQDAPPDPGAGGGGMEAMAAMQKQMAAVLDGQREIMEMLRRRLGRF